MQSSNPATITDWVFDLDNTLYPRHCDLFAQIDVRMTEYVMRLTGMAREPARRLQKQLYRDHGTTLAGLMADYAIDPHDYLADVHRIDYSPVPRDAPLKAAIAALPGRKHIFTNGDRAHAENTLHALGLSDSFDSLFDIVAAEFEPKPRRAAYDRFLSAHGIDCRSAIMFEDMARNLEIPKSLGMVTVLIVPAAHHEHSAEAWELDGHAGGHDHVDHVTHDLAGFLVERVSALEKVR